MTKKALWELASIFNPGNNIYQGETPLLIAVGAVGKALEITVTPPPKSETSITLESIARASGFRIRRVTLSSNWWRKDCGPLLAFTKKENIPVAILPIKPTKYEILDPINLTRTPLNQQTAEQLGAIAYTFYRPLPDKEIKLLDLLKFTLRNRITDLLKILGMALIITLLGMLTPQITGLLIDYAIPDANRQLLIQMGLGLFAASCGVVIFQLAQSFTILRFQTHASYDAQAAMWDRLLKLKPTFFRQYSTGDLHNRVSAISQIRNQLSGSILRILFTSLFSLLNLGLLLIYSVSLAIVAIIMALIAMIISTISAVMIKEKMRPLQQLSGEIFGLTVQLINGVSKLRVAVAEAEAFACWAKKYTQQVKLILSTQLMEDLLTTFNAIFPSISSILLFGLTVSLIKSSDAQTELSTGTFLAFNTAFGIFITSVTRLSNTIINLLDVSILWERSQPILQTKLEVDQNKFHPGKLLGEIKLDHISFSYSQDSPLVLDNVTLEAKAGEFIAIVGPSGSGKSTLIRLLLGFETPQMGTIFYDSRDLSRLDITVVRQQLGVVLQNGRIMSGSIWKNIAGGAIVTQDETWQALQQAGLRDEVEKMPMGIHTILSEGGTNLSGGQRQRLLIARALAYKPQILLFDEATSALDNPTQLIVTNSLENLGLTRIIIAHRLSTIRHADKIYVLANGRIVQTGTFVELMQQKGLFQQLASRQIV